MTLEDKAKLEQLHQSSKGHRGFSSLEFDEFIVDATNEGKDTNEILEEVRNRFDLKKLTGVQLRGRLGGLRHRGVNVAYKYAIKDGKRVPGVTGNAKIAVRKKKVRQTHRAAFAPCNCASRFLKARTAAPFARVGALLRFNGDSEELIDKYISEVVREAVLVDLKRLGV